MKLFTFSAYSDKPSLLPVGGSRLLLALLDTCIVQSDVWVFMFAKVYITLKFYPVANWIASCALFRNVDKFNWLPYAFVLSLPTFSITYSVINEFTFHELKADYVRTD